MVLTLQLNVGEAEAAQVPASELEGAKTLLAALLVEVEQRKNVILALNAALQRRDVAAINEGIAEGETGVCPGGKPEGLSAGRRSRKGRAWPSSGIRCVWGSTRFGASPRCRTAGPKSGSFGLLDGNGRSRLGVGR